MVFLTTGSTNQGVNLHQFLPLMNKTLAGLMWLLFITKYSSAQAVQKDTLFSISIKTVPSNFATQHLGFFCQKELLLQQHTGRQFYFRLGSKEYVDYLEQKPNAARRLN